MSFIVLQLFHFTFDPPISCKKEEGDNIVDLVADCPGLDDDVVHKVKGGVINWLRSGSLGDGLSDSDPKAATEKVLIYVAMISEDMVEQ